MKFMTMMMCLSAAFAILAAVAWITSTIVFVPAPPGVGLGAVLGGNIYDKDRWGRPYDVVETLKKQSRWNQYAAWAAAAAAVFQALAIFPLPA